MIEQAIKSTERKVAYTFTRLSARLNEWYDVQQGQDVVSGSVDLFEDSGILSAEERRKRQLESMQEGWLRISVILYDFTSSECRWAR